MTGLEVTEVNITVYDVVLFDEDASAPNPRAGRGFSERPRPDPNPPSGSPPWSWAFPDVAGLHGGQFGEVATYLPGRRVSGVTLTDTACAIHIGVSYPANVVDVADRVRAALAAEVAVPVHVTVEDVELTEVRTPGATDMNNTVIGLITGLLLALGRDHRRLRRLRLRGPARRNRDGDRRTPGRPRGSRRPPAGSGTWLTRSTRARPRWTTPAPHPGRPTPRRATRLLSTPVRTRTAHSIVSAVPAAG